MDDILQFQGTLGQLVLNLTNAYSGEEIEIDDEYNINTSSYDGGDGFDILAMSNLGDYLAVENTVGVQLIQNIEQISAGDGGDVINLSSNNITLNDITIFGGFGDDILWGNVGDDFIAGNNGNDIIDGGPGNDNLRGENDDDRISGGNGNDIVDGGNGNDTLIGGAGNDIYKTGQGQDIIIEQAGAETNTIDFQPFINASNLVFTPDNFDLIITWGTTDSITIVNQFAGDGSGIETMDLFDIDILDFTTINLRDLTFTTPTQGNDILTGTTGDDTLTGLGGNDILSGGLGSDLLQGGAGNDILNYSADEIWPTGFVAWNVGNPGEVINGDRVVVNPRDRNHDAFDGGDGIDTIQMGDAADALFLDDRYSPNPLGNNTARIIDVEIIRAGGGNDIVDLTSKQFSYGDVEIYGDGGNDVLWGNAGNDRIEGGTGDDHLDGAGGNDILIGGAGTDKLYGQGGADTFVLDILDGNIDTFADFDTSEGDIIDISSVLDSYDPLTDAISDFVQLTDNGGDTQLQISEDGDGAFMTAALITGGVGSDTLTDLINNGNLIVE